MTPLTKLDNFYLKREDLNPTGSAKDRSLSLQIAKANQLKMPGAVISSSGNAAVSALHFCHQSNLPLKIFLSTKINSHKLKFLESLLTKNNQITLTTTPNSAAFKFAKANNFYFLRQSTDPVALQGYQQIGQEILAQLPTVSSVFVPVGSGTTLLGLASTLPVSVKIFGVQPASFCPITGQFGNYTPEESTITDALSVKLLPNKNKIIQTLKTRGGGLTVSNQSTQENYCYLQDRQILVSPETGLALAGLQLAQKLNYPVGNFPVIIATGVQR